MFMNSTTISTSFKSSSLYSTIGLPLVGALAIALASQVKFDLGFTPVPITGQTFAVLLWGMVFGSRQGASAAITYLVAGALGMPVFAGFSSLPALWGPTSGYLLGFVPGAWLAGYLTERVRKPNPLLGAAIAFIAHIPILLVGSLGMLAFVGWSNLLSLAVLPFVVGDVIKSIAAGIVGWSVS